MMIATKDQLAAATDQAWRREWARAHQVYQTTGDREQFNRVIVACKDAYGLPIHPEFVLPWLKEAPHGH